MRSGNTDRDYISSSLSTVVRAFNVLAPGNDAAKQEILKCLGYAPARKEKSPLPSNIGVIEAEGDNKIDDVQTSIGIDEISSEAKRPPLKPSKLTYVEKDALPPPVWLDKVPLVPVSATASDPFSEVLEPLFSPKYSRAIISRATSQDLPIGNIDIDQVVNFICQGKPITNLPVCRLPSLARGIQLLIDQNIGMEPFRRDISQLTREVMCIVSRYNVEVMRFNGSPLWGVQKGLLEPTQQYIPPSDGRAVLIISDLGRATEKTGFAVADVNAWTAFVKKLKRASTSARVIMPYSETFRLGSLPKSLRLIVWDRKTSVASIARKKVPVANINFSGTEKKSSKIWSLNSQTIQLAVLASLATRVEPQLLRALRLELAPEINVESEALLWFSEIIQTHAPTGIVFHSSIREELQKHLAQSSELLDSTYKIVKRYHRRSAPILQQEEALTYSALKGDLNEVKQILRSFVATLIDPMRDGVATWAAQGLLRVPKVVSDMEEYKMLAAGTAMRLGEIPEPIKSPGGDPQHGWTWLNPRKNMIKAALNLREGAIEFGPVGMRSSHKIDLPDTMPVIIEITWYEDNTRYVEYLKINPGRPSLFEIQSDRIELNVQGGHRYQIEAIKDEDQTSSQKFMARNRLPRVQLEYDLETYPKKEKIELPFVVGVMADLAGMPSEDNPLPPVSVRKMLDIDVDNFDSRMYAIQPKLNLIVPNKLKGRGDLMVHLSFQRMDDFRPEAIARQVEVLSTMLDERILLANLLARMDGNDAAERLVDELIIDHTFLSTFALLPISDDELVGVTPVQSKFQPLSNAEEAIHVNRLDSFKTLLEKAFRYRSYRVQEKVEQALTILAIYLLENKTDISTDAVQTVWAIINAIDRKLSAQINPILHHENFQRLEGAWRGLYYLVSKTETDEMLKIRVMSITTTELEKLFKKFKGESWDQNPIFEKVYANEFGMLGGEPYGCLIGDFYFDHQPQNVEILRGMAQIAAAAHAPFIAGVASSVMQMESWQELANIVDLSAPFHRQEYAAWRSLRDSEDARYIGLAMPRYLARMPYGSETDPVKVFNFEEDLEGAESSHYCWSNSAYAMAANINRSFKLYGWCSRIRGVKSGGMVEGLPVHTFPTDDGGVDMKCPTEIAIGDRREAELAKIGFMPLIHRYNTDVTVFIGAQSLQKPAEYDDPDATANANLAARLPYLFACCRFVHYLKCIVRDKVGSFSSPKDMQRYLQQWILQYVDSDAPKSSEAVKARKPLAAAEIVIQEAEMVKPSLFDLDNLDSDIDMSNVEGQSDYYHASIYLRPHYQLEGLTVSLRLVSKFQPVSE